MKRKHFENKNDVITIFPIVSWCKCEFCDSEVRREKVYRWVGIGFRCFFQYACNECVTSISECNQKIELRKLSNKVEGVPSPPQMRQLAY